MSNPNKVTSPTRQELHTTINGELPPLSVGNTAEIRAKCNEFFRERKLDISAKSLKGVERTTDMGYATDTTDTHLTLSEVQRLLP